VHLDKQDLPDDSVMVAVDVPASVDIHTTHWRTAFEQSDRLGYPAVLVPSVIVPREHNLVLYPDAPTFDATVLWTEPFRFDDRLFPASSGR
jgi:RES domain-containing protein